MNDRLALIDLGAAKATQPICDAVFHGLKGEEKTLPCRFFYDQTGSEIFEQITDLPEYYLTRCESEILSESSDEIIEAAGKCTTIVEFGSGSSAKTRYLLSAGLKANPHLHYIPIDISRDFLVASANRLLDEYSELKVTALAAEYMDAMDSVPCCSEPRLFALLGSNIGNFTAHEALEFLRKLSSAMDPYDKLLLGADLVKNREILFDAYNDSAGVTADFNLNLLRRINEELKANFALDGYTHFAPYDEENSRIEMRLVSNRDQSVYIEDLETTFHFREGDHIRTEWSHKYTKASLESLTSKAGLHVEKCWTDSKGYFAEFLLGKN